jgi:hypothetical protein
MTRSAVDRELKSLAGKLLIELTLAARQECFSALMDRHIEYVRRRIKQILIFSGRATAGRAISSTTSVRCLVWSPISGAYENSRTGVNDKAPTYLFGPRFNLRHFARWTPYLQFLFGGAHAWSGPKDSQQARDSFATAAGGGLDFNWTKHISIKPIQVEYLMTQFDSASLGGLRQSTRTTFGTRAAWCLGLASSRAAADWRLGRNRIERRFRVF